MEQFDDFVDLEPAIAHQQQHVEPAIIASSNKSPSKSTHPQPFDEFENVAPPQLVDPLANLSEEERKILVEQLIRQTPEYNTAWELELWKNIEKNNFLAMLKKKEDDKTREWEAYFRERDTQAKEQLMEKQVQLDSLEKQLVSRLDDLDIKKQKLLDAERELRRKKQELEADYERKCVEMQHSLQLTKEQCAHKIALYEQDLASWRKREEDARVQVVDAQQKMFHLAKEHEQHAEQSVQLVKQQLEQCKKSKKNYKFYYKQQQEQILQLKNEKQQLYQELLLMRNQLNTAQSAKKKSPTNSKPIAVQKSPMQPTPTNNHVQSPKEDVHLHVHTLDSARAQELARLMKRKKELLDTGVYDSESDVIKQMEAKIVQLMQDKSP